MCENSGPTKLAVTIDAPGAVLHGYLFAPQSGQPRLAIVIHPATGVPQSYYARFARWLAEDRQAAVLIYDYRDMGESSRGPMKDSRATMSDWGVLDQSVALDFLCERYPALPVWVIGHSLGGMCLPWHDKADRVERLITVASGKAYFTRHPLSYIPAVLLFWFVLGPVTTRLFGYLPGKFAGIGADLPANAFWQWRRWCLSRDFYKGDWGNAMPVPDLGRMKGDVTLTAISDDVMMTAESVKRLAESYPAARVRFREITPDSVGLKNIGHLRIFSERCKAAWPAILEENGEALRQAA
ncbi:MAG: alpha/beta fold hydrolase [Rhodomicrobiaceae bacterium]